MTDNKNINEYVNEQRCINEQNRFNRNVNVNEHVIIYESRHETNTDM